MSDVFHDRISDGYIEQIFEVIRETPQHTYQILTKRAARLARFFRMREVPDNAWLGVSVENKKHGVPRIVFASTNHVTGFYRQDEVIDPAMPVRPDGHYGISKAFGENLSRFYFDRYGIETVCLRIGSSFPEPRDRRMLATWLSYDDLERLVVASLTAPVVGHSIVYGMSDNTTTWWDNNSARHIGFRPQDSSEPFRAAAEARQPRLDHNDPAVIFQGGAFVRTGPLE